MQKSEVKDLTVGSPMKLILSFAVPMLLGFLFQQFYNMVDTIIVGKCLGVSSLAAVGSTGSINFMIIGFCTGACSGFAIPVAQKFGAGDYKGMRKFVANAGWLSAVFAVVMTAVVGALCMNILQWMNTPEDIIQGAYDYIFVIFLGIPVTYLYNMLAGIIRSLGDSKTPVYFLLLSSLLNIGLDFFTILGLGMGVGGPALATVISQGISAVLCLIYMIRHYPILHMKDRIVSDLHDPALSDPSYERRRVEAGRTHARHTLQHGDSYGTSVFHHGHRQRCAPDCGKFSGFYGGCGRFYGKQGQYVLLLSV